VIGGPPCVDFSGANANRQGVQGEMGSYILRFSEIVQEVKNHSLQKGEPVFFLCENVPISSNDGLEVIEEKFQTIGITVDSKYFSAAKRNRMFFTNVSEGLHRCHWLIFYERHLSLPFILSFILCDEDSTKKNQLGTT